ncbi:MAG: hypothetical protein JXB50_08060 [Spirochaetes bacterium]|nr:hypothetical protein [Spirochaetota bacterium]
MTNNNISKKELANKVMEIISGRLGQLQLLAELKEKLEDSIEAMELIANTKIEIKCDHSVEKLMKNYSFKKLIDRAKNEIEKLKVITNLNNELKKLLPAAKPAAAKNKKVVIYKGICKMGEMGYVTVTSKGETRKEFITLMRNKGYTMSDRRVKEKSVFDFIMDHTSGNSKIWNFITTIEDCENFKKDGMFYVNRKIHEQNERRQKKTTLHV